MHIGTGLATLLLSMACLTACDPAAQPAALIGQPIATLQATAAPPPHEPSAAAAAANSQLMGTVAQDAADRADREKTLLVQKRLREQERQHKQALDSVRRGDGNERCLHGQKLRHVTNGWEQDGTC